MTKRVTLSHRTDKQITRIFDDDKYYIDSTFSRAWHTLFNQKQIERFLKFDNFLHTFNLNIF